MATHALGPRFVLSLLLMAPQAPHTIPGSAAHGHVLMATRSGARRVDDEGVHVRGRLLMTPQAPGHRNGVVLLVAPLTIQFRYREREPFVMALHASQALVRAVSERKLPFGRPVPDREGERPAQREHSVLSHEVRVACGALLHGPFRVVAAPAVLHGPNRGSPMRRLHSVAGQALHLLVLDMAESTQRLLRAPELLASHKRSTSKHDRCHEPRQTHHRDPARWQTRHPLRLASAARTGSKPGPWGLMPHPPDAEWHCVQSAWE
jgi:hypothetical protein